MPFQNTGHSILHPTQSARAILGQLPLIFEPNQGQADGGVKFLSRGPGYSLFLDATGAVLGVRVADSPARERRQKFVRMRLAGANPSAVVAGSDPLPGKSSYLMGNDPHKWHSGIPQFAAVRYQQVYPGIDLLFYGNQGRLEYDFRVAPGADPDQAEMQFEGASKLEVSGGDLLLTAENEGGLRLQAPRIYQRDGESRKAVAGRFVLRAENRVGFEIGPYDHTRELVIDPFFNFASYFGGSGSETSPSVAVNGDGNIYLVGTTTDSPENSFTDASSTVQTLIPTTLTLSASSPNHIFVTKIIPSQPPAVAYETFLGGSGSDSSAGIGVDGGGNVYIVGNTSSPDFPIQGIPYQTAPRTKGAQCASITCTSVFVSVLDTAGTALTYSTYLSGNGNDQASGMAIDANADVFVTGTTTSNDAPAGNPNPDDFPASFLPTPFQTAPAPGSAIQFFVTKVNTRIPSIGGIAYSTYFGGATGAIATGGGVAVDSNGNIYFSGTTNFFNSGLGQFGDSNQSIDFPILNAYQPCLDTPPPTVLANPNPCTAPAAPAPTDAFAAKINPIAQAGSQLLFSTYLGGTGTDTSTSIALDSGAANILLTGSTNSADFVLPTGATAFQPCLNNPGLLTCPTTVSSNTDAYVARFSNPAVSTTGTPIDVALNYFTYLGGSLNDSGTSIVVDTAGDALLTGATNSTDFPVTVPGALQSTLNGTQNAFLAHIDTATVTVTNGVGSFVTYYGGNAVDTGTSIAVDPVTLNTYFAGQTTSTNLQIPNPLPSPPLLGQSHAFVADLAPAPNVCINCVAPVFSSPGVQSAGNPVTVTFTVANEGPDLATSIFVNLTVSSGVTLTSATASSGSCSAPVSNNIVCTIPTLQDGATSQIAVQATPIGACTACSAMAQVIKVNNTNTSIVPATASFSAGAFSMTVGPSSQTVEAGHVAQYTVVVSPLPVFASNVSISCSSPPPSATCTPTTATLNFLNSNGPQTSVLNLTTTPQPPNTIGSGTWRGPVYAFWLMVPGMTLLGLGAGRKRLRRVWLSGLALVLFFTLILLQPSCNHGSTTPPPVSGTPSGTYTLTVTATSGTFTSSASFQVTVIP